jgi:hypothetical protein
MKSSVKEDLQASRCEDKKVSRASTGGSFL